MKQRTRMTVAAVALLVLLPAAAQADVFSMGGTQNVDGTWTGLASLEMVPVGNPGNAGELSGAGAGGYGPDAIVGGVSYTYQIGKFEVTAGQYTEFLNKVAATDTYGLYSIYMALTNGCGIQQSGLAGTYTYTVATDWANRPVNYVSWGDAARFANWLENGQPTGGQTISTTEDGSYFLNGATSDVALMAVTRKPGATWVIPTEDEWYKAAYYDSLKPGGAGYWDYPMMSDIPTVPSNDLLTPDPGNNANFTQNGRTIGSPYYRTPVGAFTNSASPYGTFDQGGNIMEWNETPLSGSSRGQRGGHWLFGSNDLLASYRFAYDPTSEDFLPGFRVASVPEPGCIALLVCGAVAALIWRWRRK